jgi:pimeloyl-ACP methyl ester carboxylesterase
MSVKMIEVAGRMVSFVEAGSGAPTVYLHGFADIHGVEAELMPFHKRIAESTRLIAPAHPGCNGTDDLPGPHAIEDAVFHYLETFDALGLKEFNLIGHSVGGWIAAELAVRHPERIKKLVLIGATGLFVTGEPIGDVFMHTQPERGVDYATLRRMYFSSSDHPLALRYYPNGRGNIDEETRRYQMVRFCSFVGFKPPYLYNRSLIDRLHRATMPSLVIWGEKDGLAPIAHGRAYAEKLPSAGSLKVIAGAGHAAHLEAPDEAGNLVSSFLRG